MVDLQGLQAPGQHPLPTDLLCHTHLSAMPPHTSPRKAKKDLLHAINPFARIKSISVLISLILTFQFFNFIKHYIIQYFDVGTLHTGGT